MLIGSIRFSFGSLINTLKMLKKVKTANTAGISRVTLGCPQERTGDTATKALPPCATWGRGWEGAVAPHGFVSLCERNLHLLLTTTLILKERLHQLPP